MNNIHALIPIRFGSQRIKGKSLRILGNKPLASYCIDELKKMEIWDRVCINSDHLIYEKFAKEKGIDFYLRKPELGTSSSMIDDYIYDYFLNTSCEYLCIVNPTSPFVSSLRYYEAIKQYEDEGLDTLLSAERIQTHCFTTSSKPVNFHIKQKHPRSQDLEPLLALNFAITILNRKIFLSSYKENGYGLYSGKIGFFLTDGFENIDIDYEDDFVEAEIGLQMMNSATDIRPKYSELFKDYLDKNIQN